MALKADIIARLNELGIGFDPKSSKSDLEALLPKGEADAAEASDRPNDSVGEANAPQAYAVCDIKGRPHRVFARSTHGGNFKALAEEYVQTHPKFTVKPTAEPVSETKSKAARPSLEDSVTVFDAKGRPHRTYSLAEHGSEYKQIASDYAARHHGWSAK